jgi:hypothetical protein
LIGPRFGPPPFRASHWLALGWLVRERLGRVGDPTFRQWPRPAAASDIFPARRTAVDVDFLVLPGLYEQRCHVGSTQPRRSQPHGCELRSDGGQVAHNRSYFPPLPLRQTLGRMGRENKRGCRGTVDGMDGPFTHVMRDPAEHVGMEGDPRDNGAATCKIAGIAFIGSNPVPAT